MSDKKDKGYDASMLRFVGNIIAGDPDQAWAFESKRELAVDAAIKTALLARKKLRKIQSEEEGDK